MIRSPLLAPLAALAATACLLFTTAASAKYVPPPLPPGAHIVTTVGWLSLVDRQKIDEECEIARTQTGFVIDVLLTEGDEPIDEVASETFKAWKVGDPGKDNGILLVVQPNFPHGQRKARLQVGKAVEAKITPAIGSDLLRNKIGPLLNNSDLVRAAIADGVVEIAKAVGADVDETVRPPLADASAAAAASGASAGAKPAAPGQGSHEDGEGGGVLWIALGGAVVAVLGYLGFKRSRGGAKA
jgi:uncharacterized protein